MVKSVGKYDLYRTLGEGAYGKVKYAIDRTNNEAVAIKVRWLPVASLLRANRTYRMASSITSYQTSHPSHAVHHIPLPPRRS